MGGLFSKPPAPKPAPVPTASDADEKVAFEVGSEDPVKKSVGKKSLTVQRKNTGLGGVVGKVASGLAVSK